jgi:parallel beta-helix repeat protein
MRVLIVPAGLICWLLSASVVCATDIGGTVSSTLTIFDDSRLVSDVTCSAALAKESCIVFGASNIKLRLNGHTLTGPIDPLHQTATASCGSPTDFANGLIGIGIDATGQNDVEIEGPGVIQHFRNWGIFLGNETFASLSHGVSAPYVRQLAVQKVTATSNCWSGLQILGVADSQFEENVWANNAVGSNGAACGGICLSNSNKNHFQKNTFCGNGAAASGNNFGIGLEGTSSGNRIEENTIGGNVNGVLVFATATGNVIRHNIIVGNPPAQVSVAFPTAAGADIHDRSTTAGANTFEDNFCLTYVGPGTPPCPHINRGESDDATDRLTSPVKNLAESKGGSTAEHGGPIFALVLVIVGSAFGIGLKQT